MTIRTRDVILGSTCNPNFCSKYYLLGFLHEIVRLLGHGVVFLGKVLVQKFTLSTTGCLGEALGGVVCLLLTRA